MRTREEEGNDGKDWMRVKEKENEGGGGVVKRRNDRSVLTRGKRETNLTRTATQRRSQGSFIDYPPARAGPRAVDYCITFTCTVVLVSRWDTTMYSSLPSPQNGAHALPRDPAMLTRHACRLAVS